MAQRPLRILCFGDSLTSGFTQSGLQYHPYHQALVRSLKAAFAGLQVVIEEDGMDGGTTSQFPSRLIVACRKNTLEHPYDWVIVLGGTNDIGTGGKPDAIFENLERTWSLAKIRKSKVLALTVPEIAYLSKSRPMTEVNARRDRLNALIMGYTSTNFHAFDFKSAFSYEAMSEEDRERYWDDRLHFTPDGYDLMGEQIAAALISILKTEEATAAGAQATTLSAVRPRKRKMFKDDEKQFEEESGNADDLRRGYIVVRRKDLD